MGVPRHREEPEPDGPDEGLPARVVDHVGRHVGRGGGSRLPDLGHGPPEERRDLGPCHLRGEDRRPRKVGEVLDPELEPRLVGLLLEGAVLLRQLGEEVDRLAEPLRLDRQVGQEFAPGAVDGAEGFGPHRPAPRVVGASSEGGRPGEDPVIGGALGRDVDQREPGASRIVELTAVERVARRILEAGRGACQGGRQPAAKPLVVGQRLRRGPVSFPRLAPVLLARVEIGLGFQGGRERRGLRSERGKARLGVVPGSHGDRDVGEAERRRSGGPSLVATAEGSRGAPQVADPERLHPFVEEAGLLGRSLPIRPARARVAERERRVGIAGETGGKARLGAVAGREDQGGREPEAGQRPGASKGKGHSRLGLP